jgi:hypothetical protein
MSDQARSPKSHFRKSPDDAQSAVKTLKETRERERERQRQRETETEAETETETETAT